MKFKYLFFILFIVTFAVNAQIDSQNKSISIPAVKSKSETGNTTVLLPSKTNESDKSSGFSIPKTNTDIKLPKKEFSMFGETFGNPGELYEKKLNKIAEDLKPEGSGEYDVLKEDAYWGDYSTKSKYIDISYRDYGQVDGDFLRVLVDDDVIKSNVGLTQGFSGFRLELKEGFNKIEFYAINEGSMIPNTAHYRIMDEWSHIITDKIWALSANVKVTVIIVKE